MSASDKRSKIPAETMCRKWRRLKCLLSTEYVKKYEKMAQFSVLVGGHDVGLFKTGFARSGETIENSS